MRPEKEEQLMAIFPEFFALPKHPKKLGPFHYFGFECEDGWFDLLSKLIKEIKTICEDINSAIEPVEAEDARIEPVVAQVKQKYGGLRFYVENGIQEIEEAIDHAEIKSFQICERCGDKGKVRRGGWIRTLCDRCDALYKQDTPSRAEKIDTIIDALKDLQAESEKSDKPDSSVE